MKTIFRRIWPFVAALAVVAAVTYSFLPGPVDVDVAPVSRGLLRVTVDHEGKTRVKEKYVVSSPLAGRLKRVEIHPGDVVTAGKTILSTIEPTDPALLDARARAESEARVRTAEASRNRALATLERDKEIHSLTQHELTRAKTLMISGGISQDDFDKAENKERVARENLNVAQFGILVTEFELELARAALLRTQPRQGSDPELWRFEIRSPVNGKVLRVFQESDTVVTPGTRLLELGDPGDLECEIDVLSTDAVKIIPGARVLFEHWGGDAPLMARVRVIEPAAFLKVSALGVEEQRVWVIADFVDPPEKYKSLGDGYRVEARIVVWERNNVLKVPAAALFRSEDQWTVFVVEKGAARLRAVQVGKSNGQETEVLGGLQSDETVILYPSDRIRNGQRIVPRSAARN